jgi:hypothetical protein
MASHTHEMTEATMDFSLRSGFQKKANLQSEIVAVALAELIANY